MNLTSNIFKKFPILEINEFVLRQIRTSDTIELINYLNDKDVNKYIPEESIPRTIEDAESEVKYMKEMFRCGYSIYWVIAKKSDDKIIGSCGFNYWNQSHKRAEISYDLGKEFWSKGIMSGTIKRILQFGFEEMQLNRIEATTTPCNLSSLKLLKKNGFEKEGVLRQHKILNGKFYDAVMLSLLNKQ